MPAMIDDAIKAAGGPTKLAKALGLDHSTIIGWRRAGRVPAERVRAVSAATGIPPHELRPDLFDAPAATTEAA
jgi:DNA-binding transcriptional regulator YdaS (Cro superfamily)